MNNPFVGHLIGRRVVMNDIYSHDESAVDYGVITDVLVHNECDVDVLVDLGDEAVWRRFPDVHFSSISPSEGSGLANFSREVAGNAAADLSGGVTITQTEDK